MGKTILVVDDEIELGELTCLLLENMGHFTYFAKSGEDGLRSIESENIDLILTDYRMSDMTGVEMLKSAHGLNLDLPPSIIVSAFLNKSIEANDYRDLKILGFMDKPFMEEELRMTVEAVLEQLDT